MKLMKKWRGFTLIELLVVMSIIAVLMGISTYGIIAVQKRSRDSKRKSDVLAVQASLESFKGDFQIYPNYTYALTKPVTSGDATTFFDDNYYYETGTDNPIANCSSVSTDKFTQTITGKTTPVYIGTAPKSVTIPTYSTLKYGFESTMAFLVCTGYATKELADPSLTNLNGYQYRVNYDYSEMIVSAQLENQGDSELGWMPDEPGENAKRYIEGSGRNNYQLSDISDTLLNSPYNYSFTGNDGYYMGQCPARPGANLVLSDRASSIYNPIINKTLNPLCNYGYVSTSPNVLSIGQPGTFNSYSTTSNTNTPPTPIPSTPTPSPTVIPTTIPTLIPTPPEV